MDNFNVKVMDPSGLAAESQSISVTLPGYNGEIGVLPGHADYVGLLGTGVLKIETSPKEHKKIVISGGFATFSNGELVILADKVNLPAGATLEAVKQEKSEVIRKLEDLGGAITNESEYLLAELKRLDALESLV